MLECWPDHSLLSIMLLRMLLHAAIESNNTSVSPVPLTAEFTARRCSAQSVPTVWQLCLHAYIWVCCVSSLVRVMPIPSSDRRHSKRVVRFPVTIALCRKHLADSTKRLENQLATREELQQQLFDMQADQGSDGHAVLQNLKILQVRQSSVNTRVSQTCA